MTAMKKEMIFNESAVQFYTNSVRERESKKSRVLFSLESKGKQGINIRSHLFATSGKMNEQHSGREWAQMVVFSQPSTGTTWRDVKSEAKEQQMCSSFLLILLDTVKSVPIRGKTIF